MRWNRSFDLFLSTTIFAIGFGVHGAWNLGEEGIQWWAQNAIYPPEFRIYIGSLELVIALCVLFRFYLKWAILIAMCIMGGATFQNFHNGFSYKHQGIEVPLLYITLGILILKMKKT